MFRNFNNRSDLIFKTHLYLFVLILIMILSGCVGSAYKNTKATNTIQAYKEFVNEYPDSEYTSEAKLSLARLEWENTRRNNTIEGYRRFINKYPKSAFASDANDKIIKSKWAQTKKKNRGYAYNIFIKEYPNSVFAREAKEKLIKLDWEDAVQTDTLPGYFKFLSKYPTGLYSAECNAKIKNLNKEAIKNKKQMLLIVAAGRGEANSLKVLLDKGFDVNGSAGSNWTPLMAAAAGGHPIEDRMQMHNFDMTIETIGLPAPPAKPGHIECIKLLLKKGADINKKNSLDKTALMLAVERGYSKIAETLLNESANYTDRYRTNEKPILYHAALMGYINTVSVLVKAGANVNETDRDSYNALHGAADGGNTDIAKILITAGTNINAQSKYGWTPLAISTYHEHIQFVKLLLENGAKADIKTLKGRTPLQMAVKKGNRQIIKLLEQY